MENVSAEVQAILSRDLVGHVGRAIGGQQYGQHMLNQLDAAAMGIPAPPSPAPRSSFSKR